jgi:hypothetical protein
MAESKHMVDPELEWEADHTGVIHLRKSQGETQFLEGYGTTDFGISPFEEKGRLPVILASTGIAAAGYLAWKYGKYALDLALLYRESLKS